MHNTVGRQIQNRESSDRVVWQKEMAVFKVVESATTATPIPNSSLISATRCFRAGSVFVDPQCDLVPSSGVVKKAKCQVFCARTRSIAAITRSTATPLMHSG
jgi:hypothetical protein